MIAFIDSHRERSSADGLRYGVQPICDVLTEHGVKIAPATYYAGKKRPPSKRAVRDEAVRDEIQRIFHDRDLGRGVSGVRKIWRLIKRQGGVDGIAVPRCQVERLMRGDGLRGVRRGKQFKTTRSDPHAVRPPDHVKRIFEADAPNLLWLVDFTYVPTWSGMKFTAFVHDAFSHRILGWRTASWMPTDLPLDALEMALWVREGEGAMTDGKLEGLIHHSDAGSQYLAVRYATRLLDVGATASIGSVGDSYDNAEAESLIGLYKAECVWPEGPWKGHGDLELATCDWVHWFNTARLHSSIDYLTPIEAEQKYYRQIKPQEHKLAG